MVSEAAIRPIRDHELSAVLRLWREADVTPPIIVLRIQSKH